MAVSQSIDTVCPCCHNRGTVISITADKAAITCKCGAVYGQVVARCTCGQHVVGQPAWITRTMPVAEKDKRDGAAAVLSFFIPGLGQIKRGHLMGGLVWLVSVAVGYVLFIVPGLALHLVCIADAYKPVGKPSVKSILIVLAAILVFVLVMVGIGMLISGLSR